MGGLNKMKLRLMGIVSCLCGLLALFLFVAWTVGGRRPCSTMLLSAQSLATGENLLIFQGTEYNDWAVARGRKGIFIYDLNARKLVYWLPLEGGQSVAWNSYLSGRLLVQDPEFDKICDVNVEGRVSGQYSVWKVPYFFSPAGDRLAFIENNRAYIVNLTEDQPQEIALAGYDAVDLSWTPDGASLLLELVEAGRGRNRDLISGEPFTLASATSDGLQVTFWPQEMKQLLPTQRGRFEMATWSADGKWIMLSQTAEQTHYLTAFPVADPEQLVTTFSRYQRVGPGSWAPDRHVAAFEFSGDWGTRIALWNVETDEIEAFVPEGEPGGVWSWIHSLTWISDHEMVVVGKLWDDPRLPLYGDNIVTEGLYLVDLTTEEVTLLTDHYFVDLEKLTYWGRRR